MIEAASLTKRYGTTVAVDDLSFTVPPGMALAPVAQSAMAPVGSMLVPTTRVPAATKPFSMKRRLTFTTMPGRIAFGSKMCVIAYTPVDARRIASAMR